MSKYRINTNYAKALYMLAEETGSTERVEADMRLVGSVFAENRQLAALFANPTMPQAKKMAVLADLFDSRVCDATRLFLRFVVRKNRAVSLGQISEAYLDLYRQANGIVLGELVTHQPVDDAMRDRMSSLVSAYTGRAVELRERTDANMLGGFKLEFDGKMYDARIRTKIRKMRLAFANNEYESKL